MLIVKSIHKLQVWGHYEYNLYRLQCADAVVHTGVHTSLELLPVSLSGLFRFWGLYYYNKEIVM